MSCFFGTVSRRKEAGVKTLIRYSLQAKGYTRKRRTIFKHNDTRTQRKSTAHRHKHVSLSLAGDLASPKTHGKFE